MKFKKYSVVTFLIVLVVCMLCLGSCSASRDMAALASRDINIIANRIDCKGKSSVRKEILLPTSAGRKLVGDEDFVEIWNDKDMKIAWVYYEIKKDVIRLVGYQAVGQPFVSLVGDWINRKSINTDATKTNLIDGLEFK